MKAWNGGYERGANGRRPTVVRGSGAASVGGANNGKGTKWGVGGAYLHSERRDGDRTIIMGWCGVVWWRSVAQRGAACTAHHQFLTRTSRNWMEESRLASQGPPWKGCRRNSSTFSSSFLQERGRDRTQVGGVARLQRGMRARSGLAAQATASPARPVTHYSGPPCSQQAAHLHMMPSRVFVAPPTLIEMAPSDCSSRKQHAGGRGVRTKRAHRRRRFACTRAACIGLPKKIAGWRRWCTHLAGGVETNAELHVKPLLGLRG